MYGEFLKTKTANYMAKTNEYVSTIPTAIILIHLNDFFKKKKKL